MFDPDLPCLRYLLDQGIIRQLDWQFAAFISQQARMQLASDQDVHEIGIIAALLSHQLAAGHICLDRSQSMVDVFELYGQHKAQFIQLYHEKCQSLGYQGHPQLHPQLLPPGPLVNYQPLSQQTPPASPLPQLDLFEQQDRITCQPIVFDGQRYYLHRYWRYQKQIIGKLLALSVPVEHSKEQLEGLRQSLHRLFPPQETSEGSNDILDKQKLAAALALTQKFTVISGGPGTGKTTTVSKILALLIEQAQQQGHRLNIALAAPTGKAAARLAESIGQAMAQFSAQIREAIPQHPTTIHRLLGAFAQRRQFMHHQDNLLHLDVLVIDEASMIDLALMYKVLMALPAHAQLILIGDQKQLASVEAGAIFADICRQYVGYGQHQVTQLANLLRLNKDVLPTANKASIKAAPLSAHICTLTQSHRFKEHSGIAFLAQTIERGDLQQLQHCWQQPAFADVSLQTWQPESYAALITQVIADYRAYFEHLQSLEIERTISQSALKNAFLLLNRVRVLCAVWQGDAGVHHANQAIEQQLVKQGYIHSRDLTWYIGKPVLIQQNDSNLGLYNGDIGITLPTPHYSDSETAQPTAYPLRVYFELADGNIKSFLPHRLPQHDTAYAMTVHKSQGSEFDHAVMILPPRWSASITRELVYTGVTRAKQKFTLLSRLETLQKAIHQQTHRQSGFDEWCLKLQSEELSITQAN